VAVAARRFVRLGLGLVLVGQLGGGATRSLRSGPGPGGSPPDRPIVWNSITILIRP